MCKVGYAGAIALCAIAGAAHAVKYGADPTSRFAKRNFLDPIIGATTGMLFGFFSPILIPAHVICYLSGGQVEDKRYIY